MTRISDKALRKKLDAATTAAGYEAPWRPVFAFEARLLATDGEHIATCWGNRDRFYVLDLLALAPDLATEVLALRKEVRRLQREKGGR